MSALDLQSPTVQQLAKQHTVSVRDVEEFAALPDEVQRLARRVLLSGAESEDAVGVALIEKAYRAGWDDCCAAMDCPWLSDREAADAARRIFKGGAA